MIVQLLTKKLIAITPNALEKKWKINNTYECYNPINATQVQNEKILFAFRVTFPYTCQKCTENTYYEGNYSMNSRRKRE